MTEHGHHHAHGSAQGHAHGSAHDHAHGSAHGHAHGSAHGHAHDRGLGGLLRYLRLLPHMWRSPVASEVVALIAPRAGERVVDLGAGMGPATVLAARSGAVVLAVDPTSYMRRIVALRRRWQPNRSGITVLSGAAESIPAGDASIDALWTINTIHHWSDKTAACRELARVMRAGGRLLLVDEDFDDPVHPHHAEVAARRSRHHFHFDQVDPVELAQALRQAGFASAEGLRSAIADRPARVIRAIR